jgi:hypothetical protein
VHFRRFSQTQRIRDLARNAALWAYFCLCCVVIGGSAVGFYNLMQPILYPNPGISTYSSTALSAPQLDTERPPERSSAVGPASGGEAVFATAIEPEGEPSGGATTGISKAKKSEAAPLSSDSKQQRRAHSTRSEEWIMRRDRLSAIIDRGQLSDLEQVSTVRQLSIIERLSTLEQLSRLGWLSKWPLAWLQPTTTLAKKNGSIVLR